MKIFNTMTRKKEELTPLVPGEYRIYVCGPTVYNYVHIGNARPVVVFDTLRRYLEYQGNRVLFVSNITDIDDKIIAKANEAGVSMQEYAGRYEAEFLKDCDGLNALPPTVRPRATEHIDEILSIVADIIENLANRTGTAPTARDVRAGTLSAAPWRAGIWARPSISTQAARI